MKKDKNVKRLREKIRKKIMKVINFKIRLLSMGLFG